MKQRVELGSQRSLGPEQLDERCYYEVVNIEGRAGFDGNENQRLSLRHANFEMPFGHLIF